MAHADMPSPTTASPVDPSSDPELNLRHAQWLPGYILKTPDEYWLFGQVVLNSVRVDRCQRRERVLRANKSRRAAFCWDDDRRLAAEETFAGLSRRPELVTRRLQKNRQGCEVLLSRWESLASVLASGANWNEEEVALAHDLLGTPLDFRNSGPGLPGEAPEALVTRETARLETLLARALEHLDGLERDAAVSGVFIEADRTLAAVVREEDACFKRMRWAGDQLEKAPRLADAAAPQSEIVPLSEPEPEPVPEPEPQPPADDATVTVEQKHLDEVKQCSRSLPGDRPIPNPRPFPVPALSMTSSPTYGLNRRERRAAAADARHGR